MISANRMVCFMKELALGPACPAIREASAPSKEKNGATRDATEKLEIIRVR